MRRFRITDDSLDDIAKTLGYDRDYFGGLLKISWLAPEITQSILEGRQQPGLNRQAIARMAGLPLRWDGQSSAKIH